MYYEVFDDIVFGYENKKTLTALSLVNKSYLDSFFDIHSYLNRRYTHEEEITRFVQKSNPFIYYQKLINGISKSTFLGFNVFEFSNNIFTELGRIIVPEHNLEFHSGDPCLFFTSGDNLSYETSQFQKWEDEVFKIEKTLNAFLKVEITREGFRANLYRTLEVIYSMASSAPKRRTNWTVFLHELIIHRKTFSPSELATRFGFKGEESGKLYKLTDPMFPMQNFLEFVHHKSLGKISTAKIASTLDLQDQKDPLKTYSNLNHHLMGKIPLCHFYLNEHMFVYKEEFDFNLYYDVFVKPWTQDKKISITYRENETNIENSLPMEEFVKELRQKKYSLVVGFYSEVSKQYLSAEPKMLKDLSHA